MAMMPKLGTRSIERTIVDRGVLPQSVERVTMSVNAESANTPPPRRCVEFHPESYLDCSRSPRIGMQAPSDGLLKNAQLRTGGI